MNIQKTIEENHEARLVVEVEAEKIEQYKRRAARKIAERGKIPGFRPGKAPYHMVVLNYGEQAILEQAIEMFLDDEYSNILQEAGVEPGATGTLESIDSLAPVKLTFRVPLAPEVHLGDYHSIRMPYEWTAPPQEEVDKALTNLRQMYATTETVEREAQEGDYLLVSLQSETPELNDENFALTIRSNNENEWPYPGFAQELIGMKAGDVKTIKHTFPEDWEIEELRGKEVEMQVTVKIVRSVSLPDLDDEFAKTVGIGETLDELKEMVKEEVEARSQDDYDQKYFAALLEKIKEGATFKYHQQEIEHESEYVLQEWSSHLARQGIEMDMYFKMRNTTREKFIEEEVRPLAKKWLENSLVLDEIVRREKLELDEDTLTAELDNVMMDLALQGFDMQKFRGDKKGQREFTHALTLKAVNHIMTRQALDVLKSIAVGTYKPPEEREAAKNETSAEAKAEETETAVPLKEAPSVAEGSSEAETKS